MIQPLRSSGSFLLAAVAATFPLFSSPASGQGAATEAPAPEAHPFAVVELFTSQGCSSSPPGDSVLSRLAEQARDNDSAVYTLSFHVTYWDYLGWADPYAAPFADAYQEDYRRAFQNRARYTAQTVVNGSFETVGSRGASIATAVNEALARPAAVGVSTSATRQRGRLAISWKLSAPAPGQHLVLAVTETATGNHVPRGENGGRDLTHVDVVRVFERGTLGEDAAGTAELELPASLANADLELTAYVQNPADRHIHGATRTAIR